MAARRTVRHMRRMWPRRVYQHAMFPRRMRLYTMRPRRTALTSLFGAGDVPSISSDAVA